MPVRGAAHRAANWEDGGKGPLSPPHATRAVSPAAKAIRRLIGMRRRISVRLRLLEDALATFSVFGAGEPRSSFRSIATLNTYRIRSPRHRSSEEVVNALLV